MKLAITAAATLAIAGIVSGLAAYGSHPGKPAAAKPGATRTSAAPTDNAPVGQAEVGRLLAADEAAITSAPGGTKAMKASYLVKAIKHQRPAWSAVLNMPGLSPSAQAGITHWLAFVNDIHAYQHGGGLDRAQVLATGVRAEADLASAYPQLSALLPH